MRDWIRQLEIQEELDKQPPYYINTEGKTVLTAYYLRKRGICCGSGCENCPYTPKHTKGNTNL